jgi:hypothetical protein
MAKEMTIERGPYGAAEEWYDKSEEKLEWPLGSEFVNRVGFKSPFTRLETPFKGATKPKGFKIISYNMDSCAEIIGELTGPLSAGLINHPYHKQSSMYWGYEWHRAEDHLSSTLRQAIQESRWILSLEDNWDGEGSPRYNERTWGRAVGFLKRNAISLWNNRSIWIDPPRISPGPNGSIDLHWKTAVRELLINIPADLNQLAGFYGDDRANNTVEGKIDTTGQNEWILMWLTK